MVQTVQMGRVLTAQMAQVAVTSGTRNGADGADGADGHSILLEALIH